MTLDQIAARDENRQSERPPDGILSAGLSPDRAEAIREMRFRLKEQKVMSSELLAPKQDAGVIEHA